MPQIETEPTPTEAPLAAPTSGPHDGVLRFDATQLVQLRRVALSRWLVRLAAPGEMRVCEHAAMIGPGPAIVMVTPAAMPELAETAVGIPLVYNRRTGDRLRCGYRPDDAPVRHFEPRVLAGAVERRRGEPRGPGGLARCLARVLAFELPRREAPNVDVKFVEAGIVAVARELNLELHLVRADRALADLTGRPDARTAPRAIRAA